MLTLFLWVEKKMHKKPWYWASFLLKPLSLEYILNFNVKKNRNGLAKKYIECIYLKLTNSVKDFDALI